MVLKVGAGGWNWEKSLQMHYPTLTKGVLKKDSCREYKTKFYEQKFTKCLGENNLPVPLYLGSLFYCHVNFKPV